MGGAEHAGTEFCRTRRDLILHLRNETVGMDAPDCNPMDAPDCNPFPNGSRVEVWWPGDRQWYVARVADTRIELHKIKGAQVPCHEVYCQFIATTSSITTSSGTLYITISFGWLK